MALATNSGRNDPTLVAANTAATQVTVGDVTAGQVEQQVVTAKFTGRIVNLPTAIYTRTNFYIRQTRQYIPSRKLRVFINFRWFFWIMAAVCCTQWFILFLVSVILGRVEPTIDTLIACLVLSLVTILTLIPTFIVYCQHLHVACWTIPWVMRQPVIPNLKTDNDHLEIAVTSLEGVYVSARNSGIGLVSQTTGKIKFHVLSPNAILQIRGARNVSVFFAVMTFTSVIWGVIVFIVSLLDTVTAIRLA